MLNDNQREGEIVARKVMIEKDGFKNKLLTIKMNHHTLIRYAIEDKLKELEDV